MPRDLPIIFSAAMARALHEGRKTMTRRLAWRRVHGGIGVSPSSWQKVNVGDRIWVRENLTRSGGYIHYAADHKILDREIVRFPGDVMARTWPTTWVQDPRPSIHMPRTASRLTLIVTNRKIEPLQDISEQDATAEGCEKSEADGSPIWHVPSVGTGRSRTSGKDCFESLWSTIHGSGSWGQNPDVVVLTFRVVKANIDSPEARAA